MNSQHLSQRGPITLLIIGILILFVPILGLLGTAFSMVWAFVEVSQSEQATPKVLASNINLSSWATAIGIAISPIGLALLIVGIIWFIKVNRRRREAST